MRKLCFLSALLMGCCLPLMAQWDSTKLSIGRWNMGVTSTGSKAFFAGGFMYGSPLPFDISLDRVDIFDGATSQWTIDQLSEPRHSVTAISAGDIAFFAGGQTGVSVSASNFSPKVDIYTASTGKWTTGKLSEGRSGMVAAVAGGKVLFAGGNKFQYLTSDAVDIYDIAANQWTVSKLPAPYTNLVAGTIGNTVVLAAPQTVAPLLLLYDVSTGRWTTKSIPLQRSGKAMAVVGNRVFLAGGTTPDGQLSDRVDIYDLTTDQWTMARLSQPRADISAITAGNRTFFAGGSTNANVVDIYDATTNQWTTAQLATGRATIVTTTAGSKVFFAGSSMGSPVVDIYDLITNQWSATQLPRVRVSLSAVSVSGKALFAENGPGTYPQNNLGRVDIYTTNAPNQALLDVSTNSVPLSATAGASASFSITANTSWSVGSSESWLTPSPVSGAGNQVITLTAAANASITSRTAVITVSSAGLSNRILTVTQAGAAPALGVSASSLPLPPNAGTLSSLTITSNTSWSVISSASWLSTNVSSGTGTQGLSVSVGENQSVNPRTATLTITADGAPAQVVRVTQSGTLTTLAISIVSPVAAAGGATSVTITSNASWSVSSSQTWLTASPVSGSGTAILTLTASANSQVESRTATVMITVDGIPSQSIIVLQAGVIILGLTNPLEKTVVLYPNPVSDKLFIRGLPPTATLLLYDTAGQLLSQPRSADPVPALSTVMLPPGRYYLLIISDQQTVSRQFIKIP